MREKKEPLTVSTCEKTIILFLVLLLCCCCEAAPQKLSISNAAISVTLHTDDATLSVTDKRTGHTWRQKSLTKGKVIQSRKLDNRIEMTWNQPGLNMNVQTELRLDKNLPEFTLALTAKGELKRSLRFPHPFVTEPSTAIRHPAEYLVVPMNEGISYPVEDKTISPRRLAAYRGKSEISSALRMCSNELYIKKLYTKLPFFC